MRFVVDIHLGNDAMQTGPDVADALRKVADFIDENGSPYDILNVYGGRHIRDRNGSRCGMWKIERDS